MKKTAILKMGHIKKSLGRSYDELIIAGMGLPKSDFVVFDIPDGDELPGDFDYKGLVISGSSLMLTNEIEWLDKVSNWILKAVNKNIPIFGICFGHQILTYALGGKVDYNPKGIEVGTKTVNLQPEAKNDKLFCIFDKELSAQTSHVQTVSALPKGAVSFATSEMEEHHIIRFADNIWGVQYHPEFDEKIIRMIIGGKARRYPGKVNAEKLLKEARGTNDGNRILKRFGEIINNKQRLLALQGKKTT
jgi:GMP synthase (glutamine-hydrolysing)